MPDIRTLHMRAHLVADALQGDLRPDAGALMRDLGNLALSGHQLVAKALKVMKMDPETEEDWMEDWEAFEKDAKAFLQAVPA